MTLTKKQIREYTKQPYHCPYCRSEELESGELCYEDNINCTVVCQKCNRAWLDVYSVVNIIEVTHDNPTNPGCKHPN